MTNNVFSMKSLISEVVETELPDDQDQLMDVTLGSNGILTLRMLAKGTETLRSRISLNIRGGKAVEAFADEENKFFQVRVDGSQVPLIMKKEQIEQFMDAVDKVLGAY